MGQYSVRLQIYLSQEQHKRLKTLGAATGKSVAALVRNAIDRYLEAPGGKPLSPDDPLWDIAGAIDSGLGDLSETHDEHLYGQK